MHQTLYIANNTYYIIYDSPRSVVEWILCAYGTKICTIECKNKKQGERVMEIIGFIHYIENILDLQDYTYISSTKIKLLWKQKVLSQ